MPTRLVLAPAIVLLFSGCFTFVALRKTNEAWSASDPSVRLGAAPVSSVALAAVRARGLDVDRLELDLVYRDPELRYSETTCSARWTLGTRAGLEWVSNPDRSGAPVAVYRGWVPSGSATGVLWDGDRLARLVEGRVVDSVSVSPPPDALAQPIIQKGRSRRVMWLVVSPVAVVCAVALDIVTLPIQILGVVIVRAQLQ